MATLLLVRIIAANVKHLRERRGWTQQDLATRAQIHRVSLAQVERGSRGPSLAMLARLARALGVKPGRLLD